MNISLCMMTSRLALLTLFLLAVFHPIAPAVDWNSLPVFIVNPNMHPGSMTSGIQETVESIHTVGGGTVYLPAGTYETKAAVSLYSTIRLIGDGISTIVTPVDETKTSVVGVIPSGSTHIPVKSNQGFEEGMDVIITDDACGPGWRPNFRTIVGFDMDDTIILNEPTVHEIRQGRKGLVVNAFPVILADGRPAVDPLENVLVTRLKIDGNRANIGQYTWQQSGVAFIRTTRSAIRNVWVDNSGFEGISDQGPEAAWNTITNNLITNSAGRGIHLGTTNLEPTVSNNRIEHNGSDGIFFCFNVQHAHLIGNTISHNAGHGIGGLDDSGPEGDNFNVIEDNLILRNDMHGIDSEDSDGDDNHPMGNTIINNIISGNSQTQPGLYCGISLENTIAYNISGNQICDNLGWGMKCRTAADITLVNNLVVSNVDGGLCFIDELPISPSTIMASIECCTIAHNGSETSGDGVYCEYAPIIITDCILWENEQDQIFFDDGPAPTVTYCDVQGGYTGMGNIDSDPLFASGPLGDYYLDHTGWPLADSPCLDAGSDLAGNIYFTLGSQTMRMDQLTTRTDHVLDTGQVDLGFHFDIRE